MLAGSALAFPAISVQAFPDTYLTTDIPYAATSITAGLNHYEAKLHSVPWRERPWQRPAGGEHASEQKPADLSAPHTALHTGATSIGG